MIVDRCAKFITDHHIKQYQNLVEYRKLMVMCPDGCERSGATLGLIHAALTMQVQRQVKWQGDCRVSVFSIVRRI